MLFHQYVFVHTGPNNVFDAQINQQPAPVRLSFAASTISNLHVVSCVKLEKCKLAFLNGKYMSVHRSETQAHR